MNDTKKILGHLVKAYMLNKGILDSFVKIGLTDNELFESNGEIAEAVYEMVGENTDEFITSATNLILSAPILSNERRTELLYSVYRNNHPEQPKPNTMSQEEFMRYFKENGGYSRPLAEGEGP